jgi:hypothetical protein
MEDAHATCPARAYQPWILIARNETAPVCVWTPI